MKRLWVILAALLLCAEGYACTTAVVSAGASANGRPLLWKQRDASDPYNVIARVTRGPLSFTGLFPASDSLRTKCYAGINEAGFAIVNNISYNMRPDSLGYDTCAGVTMAAALASCRTVEDFAAMLAGLPRPMNLSTNFGVADSHGGAAYFEVGDSTFVRYDVPDGGMLFRTNFSLSGDPSRGRGHERFRTMEALTGQQGRFDASFFLGAGRSFLAEGRDAIAGSGTAGLREHGFIPRSTTTAGIVIECPVDEGERGLMWCATGYTPCCYAIPVWEGLELPAAVRGEANLAAVALHGQVHDGKMLKVKPLRRVLRAVERRERRELRRGRKVQRRMSPEEVRRYNEGADRRFGKFKKKFGL